MSKPKKRKGSPPSRAYLISFGDTMTALLAFFIALNSLAHEQTGAHLYSGTGAFIRAFSSAGHVGPFQSRRSKRVIAQNERAPLYALSENLDKNQGKVGPDEKGKNERVLDREKEQFQNFLHQLEQEVDLKTLPQLSDQVVIDSFERPDSETGKLSSHASQLISDAITRLRQPNTTMEVILWANMPAAISLNKKMDELKRVRQEVESAYWMNAKQRTRVKYRVKPWLFADAKRPYLSVVIGKEGK